MQIPESYPEELREKVQEYLNINPKAEIIDATYSDGPYYKIWEVIVWAYNYSIFTFAFAKRSHESRVSIERITDANIDAIVKWRRRRK